MKSLQAPLSDLTAHADCLRDLPKHPNRWLREMFEPNAAVCVARAPGRLDVMGGIADYSGSLVLELPIREAAFAAVQAVSDPGIVVVTVGTGNGDIRRVSLTGLEWSELLKIDYDSIRQRLRESADAAWAAYVLGPILVLLRETSAQLNGGLRILIHSRVPEGKGVSSSAALEVATMRAAAALAGRELDGQQIARLCQVAENRVVGAPCGIMDQITAAVGRENELLALRCQPDAVEGYVPIPKDIAFWGIDSGIRHQVSGSDYTSVRIGAFMGYRIIAEAAGVKTRPAADVSGVIDVADSQWHGYLSNIKPAEFRAQFESIVPLEMSGREFLDRYGGTTDRVTLVDPARTYAVRQPTLHPIEENARVGRFHELLQNVVSEQALREMGELMFASHESYSACGLGSDGTDFLVKLVRDAGPASGLFGAKITGGGSGGTVAVLGSAVVAAAIESVARRYTEISGRAAYVFRGSSPGACWTNVQQVTI